ncbi:hypothetical protein [Gottfriedia luciferensis]|uniref:hypothetical protein n=1 Tax=Gottfriedia luciferensis TaxID=178774 RepID=UPI000B4431B7|nr:hypothetical protein [Gottfriedia luciferensis]
MILQELISNINKSVDNLELSIARKYIEENIEILKENKTLLNSNSRELLVFISNRQKDGYEQLTRNELMIIHAINTNATKFDLRELKKLVKENAMLLVKKDVFDFLNADAKVILEGMKAINQ